LFISSSLLLYKHQRTKLYNICMIWLTNHPLHLSSHAQQQRPDPTFPQPPWSKPDAAPLLPSVLSLLLLRPTPNDPRYKLSSPSSLPTSRFDADSVVPHLGVRFQAQFEMGRSWNRNWSIVCLWWRRCPRIPLWRLRSTNLGNRSYGPLICQIRRRWRPWMFVTRCCPISLLLKARLWCLHGVQVRVFIFLCARMRFLHWLDLLMCGNLRWNCGEIEGGWSSPKEREETCCEIVPQDCVGKAPLSVF